tara:strand:+ start:459 stop:689 length:231 start_codon:yes stop_codon:yes gene_type:complete
MENVNEMVKCQDCDEMVPHPGKRLAQRWSRVRRMVDAEALCEECKTQRGLRDLERRVELILNNPKLAALIKKREDL